MTWNRHRIDDGVRVSTQVSLIDAWTHLHMLGSLGLFFHSLNLSPSKVDAIASCPCHCMQEASLFSCISICEEPHYSSCTWFFGLEKFERWTVALATVCKLPCGLWKNGFEREEGILNASSTPKSYIFGFARSDISFPNRLRLQTVKCVTASSHIYPSTILTKHQ
jgi:hypothetical protein